MQPKESTYNQIVLTDNFGVERSFKVSDWHNVAISDIDHRPKYAFPVEMKGKTLFGF